jgi:hypothetical protein
MKIMAIVDRHGLPLSVSTHAANHHEVCLVRLCFDFYMIEAKPENLIGDRAYESDPLDEELRNDGIEMIAPHRSNRSKPPTQDRRRLSRYMRRWLVERFFVWIQWQRRIPSAGSTTLRISSALSSSPASLSSSDDFEIRSRCLVPRNRGALYHDLQRDELWGKFFMAAPQRLRRSVEQYRIRAGRPLRHQSKDRGQMAPTQFGLRCPHGAEGASLDGS